MLTYFCPLWRSDVQAEVKQWKHIFLSTLYNLYIRITQAINHKDVGNVLNVSISVKEVGIFLYYQSDYQNYTFEDNISLFHAVEVAGSN